MPKAYWVVTYRSISDQNALAAYAKLAAPAIAAHGGRYVVRGNPIKTYEAGINQRCTIIEFDSAEKAIQAHECSEYQAALKHLVAVPNGTFGSWRASRRILK